MILIFNEKLEEKEHFRNSVYTFLPKKIYIWIVFVEELEEKAL